MEGVGRGSNERLLQSRMGGYDDQPLVFVRSLDNYDIVP